MSQGEKASLVGSQTSMFAIVVCVLPYSETSNQAGECVFEVKVLMEQVYIYGVKFIQQ